MSDSRIPLRPLAVREADGRIAVYVGAGFRFLDEETARRLRDQLTQALESAGPEKEPA